MVNNRESELRNKPEDEIMRQYFLCRFGPAVFFFNLLKYSILKIFFQPIISAPNSEGNIQGRTEVRCSRGAGSYDAQFNRPCNLAELAQKKKNRL